MPSKSKLIKQNYWLMKSEPFCFSINDLKNKKKEPWDGVRNYQVRNMMRDQMRVGDLALFYHSNTKEIGCVGTMKIVSDAYPDPTQFDPKSDHFDPMSDRNKPRWLLVEVQYQATFSRLVSLAEIKIDPAFSGFPLIAKGNRLSIMPISKKHFDRICTLAVA